ncbi:hypothetical protein [Kineococcus terrestris]|uniref:hypothetical protein n=1 Tax=Kineococcus terrestris TaxID=2044856 RepID=UPI0034DADF67
MTSPRLARLVEFDRTTKELRIEGHIFPFFVGPDVSVNHDGSGPALVTLTLLADRVEIETRSAAQKLDDDGVPDDWSAAFLG